MQILTLLCCLLTTAAAAVQASDTADLAGVGTVWTGGTADEPKVENPGNASTRSRRVKVEIQAGQTTQENQRPAAGSWDGQPSWEWDYGKKRNLYFEPFAGLGNRLRALASAVVLAREAGVGLKVVWREELDCKETCGNSPPFNASWPDLFSYPNLRLAPNFPGSNFSVDRENIYLRENGHLEDPLLAPIVPGFNCTVFYAQNYSHFQYLMSNKWTHVDGEEVICIKSDTWLTKHGEQDGKFFFRTLQPAPQVQSLVDDYKNANSWEKYHMIGAHIRRTDLSIVTPGGGHASVESLVPLSRYIDPLKQLTAMVPEDVQHEVRYFLATDDAETQRSMQDAFKDGQLMTYPKTAWSRNSVEGIQQALVDVLLLSDCPVLIGTYYSSYSETAKLMGWPYYIQIGNELHALSQETKFEKDPSMRKKLPQRSKRSRSKRLMGD